MTPAHAGPTRWEAAVYGDMVCRSTNRISQRKEEGANGCAPFHYIYIERNRVLSKLTAPGFYIRGL